MRTVVVLAAVAVWVLPQASGAPEVTSYLTDGGGAGFVVEMKNTTGSELTVVIARGQCRSRIDGAGEGGSAGSSGAVTVAPGSAWREVVRFVTAIRSSATFEAADAARPVTVYRFLRVELTPGKHVVSFNCGGTWSPETQFYWNTPISK